MSVRVQIQISGTRYTFLRNSSFPIICANKTCILYAAPCVATRLHVRGVRGAGDPVGQCSVTRSRNKHVFSSLVLPLTPLNFLSQPVKTPRTPLLTRLFSPCIRPPA